MNQFIKHKSEVAVHTLPASSRGPCQRALPKMVPYNFAVVSKKKNIYIYMPCFDAASDNPWHFTHTYTSNNCYPDVL